MVWTQPLMPVADIAVHFLLVDAHAAGPGMDPG